MLTIRLVESVFQNDNAVSQKTQIKIVLFNQNSFFNTISTNLIKTRIGVKMFLKLQIKHKFDLYV